MQSEYGPKKKELLLPKSVRLPATIKEFLDTASDEFEMADWLRNLITSKVEDLPEYKKWLQAKGA